MKVLSPAQRSDDEECPHSAPDLVLDSESTRNLRVVDLNGKRAVAAVGHIDESIKPELMREARAVFDSIVFKSYK